MGRPSAAFSEPEVPCTSQGLRVMWGWPASPGRIKADTETCFWVPQANNVRERRLSNCP